MPQVTSLHGAGAIPEAAVCLSEASSARMLSNLLARWGFQPRAVEGPAAIVELLASSTRPDLAVLDWEGSGGNGTELVRRIRDAGSTTYILLLVPSTEFPLTEAAMAAGTDDLANKPFDVSEMRLRIALASSVLKRRPPRRARVRDDDDSRDSEAEIHHKDRLATLGRLTAGVAHEINNPAAFIAGNLRMIEDAWPLLEKRVRHSLSIDPGDDERRVRFCLEETPPAFAGIRRGVDRISRIVEDLRLYSRQREVRRVPLVVSALAEEVRALMASRLRDRTSLAIDVPAGLLVEADPQQMSQVLVNLVGNAIDALEQRPSGSIRIAAGTTGESVWIAVEDDGPGVPPDLVERVFLPFVSTKDGRGTGLGLSICREILRSYGGTLEYAPAVPHGARFLMTLPQGRPE